MNIRGDRLYHEHITWDQGTVLRQLGLMPEYLPFPYPIPPESGKEGARAGQDGATAAGGSVEYRVPVTGIDTAKKLRDRNSAPSNAMFDYKIRRV